MSKLNFWSEPEMCRTYKCISTNIFTVGGERISDTLIENRLTIALLAKTSETIDIEIYVEGTEIQKGLEFLPKEYMEVIQQLSTLRDHFTCRIERQGKMLDIINFEQLQDRWKCLKENLWENKNFTKEDIGKLVEAGDKEFSNKAVFMEELNKNMVFETLWLALAQRGAISERKFYSCIFPDEEIKAQVEMENGEDGEKLMEYCLKSTRTEVDENAFKKAYLKEFSLLGRPYQSYSFDFLAVKTVHKEDNWFNSIKCSISERISDAVCVDVLCVIQEEDGNGE